VIDGRIDEAASIVDPVAELLGADLAAGDFVVTVAQPGPREDAIAEIERCLARFPRGPFAALSCGEAWLELDDAARADPPTSSRAPARAPGATTPAPAAAAASSSTAAARSPPPRPRAAGQAARRPGLAPQRLVLVAGGAARAPRGVSAARGGTPSSCCRCGRSIGASRRSGPRWSRCGGGDPAPSPTAPPAVAGPRRTSRALGSNVALSWPETHSATGLDGARGCSAGGVAFSWARGAFSMMLMVSRSSIIIHEGPSAP